MEPNVDRRAWTRLLYPIWMCSLAASYVHLRQTIFLPEYVNFGKGWAKRQAAKDAANIRSLTAAAGPKIAGCCSPLNAVLTS